VRCAGSPDGDLTVCHFPKGPGVEARDEDIVLDPALTALGNSASTSS
jgi:hypothetical protein